MTVLKPTPKTMAECLTLFEQADDLDPTRQKLVAADVRVAFAITPELAIHDPNGTAIAHLLDRFTENKRLKNIRSNIRFMLKWLLDHFPETSNRSLTPSWEKVLDTPGLGHYKRYTLHRIARYSSIRNIEPVDVTDEVVQAFHSHIDKIGSVRDPKACVRKLIKTWNTYQGTVVGWPGHCLTPLPRPKPMVPSYNEIGERLAAEIGACLNFFEQSRSKPTEGPICFSEDDLLADLDPPDLEESTLDVYCRYLRRAVRIISEQTNRPYEQVRLSELAHRRTAILIMNTMSTELDAKKKGVHSLRTMINVLVSVNRHYFQADEELIKKLVKERKRVPKPKLEMTAKNMERLQKLVREKREELFRLPALLLSGAVKQVQNGAFRPKHIVDAEVAVAIAILLHDPRRIGNLCKIHIGPHLKIGVGKKAVSSLYTPEEMVKNDANLWRDIPQDVARLLQIYISEIHPHNRHGSSTALFPGGGTAGHKTASNFGTQISRRIRQYIGIQMNPHLFRHFVVLMHLEMYPGDYDTCAALLGNTNLTIIRKIYGGLEKHIALKRAREVTTQFKLQSDLDPENMARIVNPVKKLSCRKKYLQ